MDRNPELPEKRAFRRMPLEDLSARLVDKGSGADVDYFPINVSADGISIFTRRQLGEGAVLDLELSGVQVPLEVVWCRPKEDDLGFFRCGLRRLIAEHRLDLLVQDELTY